MSLVAKLQWAWIKSSINVFFVPQKKEKEKKTKVISHRRLDFAKNTSTLPCSFHLLLIKDNSNLILS